MHFSESYTERQAKKGLVFAKFTCDFSEPNLTGRPVSPHVTIYKFPVGAITSITNRVTGVALTIGESKLRVQSSHE